MSFWKKIFSSSSPRDLFLKFTPEGSSWRAIHWNSDLKAPLHRNLVLEIKSAHDEIIKWDDFGDKKIVQFVKNDSVVKSHRVSDSDQELPDLMNIALHSVLKFSLELDQPFMLEPVSGATALDMQNETRAQQWLEVSFKTLSNALDKFAVQKDLILSASIFSGIVPDSGERVLRVMIFNLDIFYYLQPDQMLRILVFDDKDQGHGTSKTPSFHQIIKVTKPQFYDEIGKLVHRIANLGEVR